MMHCRHLLLLSTTGILLAAATPHALAAGKTERASVSSAEAQADNDSIAPSLGGGGRRVAFQSRAANLAPVDPASLDELTFCCNVFLRDRDAGTTELVSTNSAETPGNALSYLPFLARNGRVVAFGSRATNLVTGDANGFDDTFVRDLKQGTTQLVSIGKSGQQGDNGSFVAAISASGRYVAFNSAASNLVPSTGTGFLNLFIHDRERRTTTVETIAFNGAPGNAPFDEFAGLNDNLKRADLSADGRFVAFESLASNLVRGDSNDTQDIFLRDRKKKQTTLVSVASNGKPADGRSFLRGVSDDGRYVAFSSDATNLVPGDSNDARDVFVRDLVKHKTTRISLTASGEQPIFSSFAFDLTSDGRYVLFDSEGVYRYDLKTKKRIRVDVSSDGEPADSGTEITSGDLSSDGRTAAFASFATNLVPDDTNETYDVFVRDLGR